MSGPTPECTIIKKRITVNSELEIKGSLQLPLLVVYPDTLFPGMGLSSLVCRYTCKIGCLKSFVAPLLLFLSLYFLFSLYSIGNVLRWLRHLELTLWCSAALFLPTARPCWFKAKKLDWSNRDPLGDWSLWNPDCPFLGCSLQQQCVLPRRHPLLCHFLHYTMQVNSCFGLRLKF